MVVKKRRRVAPSNATIVDNVERFLEEVEAPDEGVFIGGGRTRLRRVIADLPPTDDDAMREVEEDLETLSNARPLTVAPRGMSIQDVLREREESVARSERNLAANRQREQEAIRDQDLYNQEEAARIREAQMRVFETTRRRRAVPPAVAPVTEIIQLETGEKRIGVSSSSRIFFVYVAPTGIEISISKCPMLKRQWGQSNGGFEGSNRTQVTEYQLLGPTRLKMVNLHTAFGKARRIVNLFIDVNPDYEAIEFKGVEDFGKFRGRARIDYKASIYTEGRNTGKLSLESMKEVFDLLTLQPPKKSASGLKNVRSLILG